ncbi:MAG: hypothetical protein K6E51_13935, partial [Treponema sp.]|nr:hypothetical protein [Treponema sp.]
NKTLSEHTAQINTTFTITDLEAASLLFTKDVVILQFPYGIASSEICDVSKEADYYQVTLSRSDVAEDTTKKQFITDIWKTNQDTLSLSFQFNDAFLLITDNFQNKTQKYVKLSITDANHLVQALQTQKTDSLPYFDIITSSR